MANNVRAFYTHFNCKVNEKYLAFANLCFVNNTFSLKLLQDLRMRLYL